jgi:CRISPR-associated protein Csb2
VPANDSVTPGRWRKLPKPEVLPAHRPRQERFFPSVTPENRLVYLIWPDASDEEVAFHRPALERLAANVISIGHSSSLTRVAVCEAPPQASHRPAKNGEPTEFVLRVPSTGRFAELEKAFRLSKRPNDPGMSQPYTRARLEEEVRIPRSVFGELFVSILEGPALPLESTLRLTETVRAAVMKHSQHPCEALSGHQLDDRKSHIRKH